MKKLLEVNYGRRAVRDLVKDIDYVSKLSPDEKEWLEIFIDATAGNNMDAQAALAGTPEKFSRLYNEIADENNARSRDVMNTFTAAPFKDTATEDDDITIETVSKVRSEFFKFYRCNRCLSLASLCECPTRQRNRPYGVEDYTPIEQSEDDVVAAIDLKRRMQAYDLLPYGTNPPDLQPGHKVKICLPHHLFKDAVGEVVAYRSDDNAHLVDVKSRKGLRDRDGVTPDTIFCWVKGQGLRRFGPLLAYTRNTKATLN